MSRMKILEASGEFFHCGKVFSPYLKKKTIRFCSNLFSELNDASVVFIQRTSVNESRGKLFIIVRGHRIAMHSRNAVVGTGVQHCRVTGC